MTLLMFYNMLFLLYISNLVKRRCSENCFFFIINRQREAHTMLKHALAPCCTKLAHIAKADHPH